MSRWLPITTALVLILAAGVANGLWVDRWSVSQELEQMTERMGHVPLTIEDWGGTNQDDDKNKELTARLIREGTLHALISREYENKQTGEKVALLMATGRPGPISTHNPLTCYGASGFTQSTSVANVTVSAKDGPALGQFSRCSFNRERNALLEALTVYWSWHSPKGWVASGNPRVSFASYRALTKIYVIRSDQGYLAGIELQPDQDPAIRFIRDCLPTIDASLFSNTKSPQEAETAAKVSPATSG